MQETPNPSGFASTIRRTRLAAAVFARLQEQHLPVVTPYSIFQILRPVLLQAKDLKLHIRPDVPTSHLRKVVANLVASRATETDHDYTRGVYRVLPVGESTADEVCSLVNPFSYVSHLSAMQRWGLTDRRPEALHLTMPSGETARRMVADRMEADYGKPISELPYGEALKLTFIQHPHVVRGRKVSVYQTKAPGAWLQVRGEHTRLATIGQTFLDMLEGPHLCGGMAHIVEVWSERAPNFRDETIAAVDQTGSPIAKVRAGYLLDEVLGWRDDARIQSWVQFAQRGGGRVLDPSKAFNSNHSEKWMLSINV